MIRDKLLLTAKANCVWVAADYDINVKVKLACFNHKYVNLEYFVCTEYTSDNNKPAELRVSKKLKEFIQNNKQSNFSLIDCPEYDKVYIYT